MVFPMILFLLHPTTQNKRGGKKLRSQKNQSRKGTWNSKIETEPYGFVYGTLTLVHC